MTWILCLKKATFLQGMLLLWSPVRDNVWKRAQKAVMSGPILDYFWRATCCISHCTSQKSCQGFYTYILPDSQGPLIIVVACAYVSSLIILGTPLMSSAILTSKPALFLKHCQDTWQKCHWFPPTHEYNYITGTVSTGTAFHQEQ